MKIELLSALFMILTFNCFALDKSLTCDTTKTQKSKKHTISVPPPPPKSPEDLDRLYKPWYDNCTFTNKHSVYRRLKKYPFSKAVKILAISYHALGIDPKKDDSLSDDFISPKNKLQRGGYYIKADTLDHETLMECKTLNKKQINRLTNIIYNTKFKKPGYNAISEGGCYEPRNAFIFINKQGKVYDYLEICFACENYSSKSRKLDIGIQCAQKYEILRVFFKSLGIRFGTKKGMHWEDEKAFKP